jgi:hypothetical protein
MADAINTGNPVSTTTFIVNKYHDIDGNEARVAVETPRGRLAFRDTNGKMQIPRTLTEAQKSVFPVDWAKPLNPGPYFDGPGLNGATLYPFNTGSLNDQENDFAIDPDTLFSTPWPAAIKQYDIPPMFYNLPVTSGNKCLVFDGGTFTYGSGNYSGVSSDYNIGSRVYADYTTGNEGKITASGGASGETVVGHVYQKDVFGVNSITVKLKGEAALP